MNSLQRDISNKDNTITTLRNELRNAERQRAAKHQELQREQKTHGDLQRISECTNVVEMIKLMDEKNPSPMLPWSWLSDSESDCEVRVPIFPVSWTLISIFATLAIDPIIGISGMIGSMEQYLM